MFYLMATKDCTVDRKWYTCDMSNCKKGIFNIEMFCKSKYHSIASMP